MSETIAFKPESLAQVHKIMARYPEGRQKSALIPVLHIAQKEFDGWLAVPVMDYVAEILSITPIEVYEVATFYTMFNLKPIGKHHIELCKTLSCMLCGSRDIKNHIKQTIGIEPGQTSEDGLFHLSEVECLGACGGAPMFALDGQYHEKLTKQRVDELVAECKK